MLSLIGLEERGPSLAGRKSAWALPDPLEPSAEPRKALDETRLFNPDWLSEGTAQINQEYIIAAVKLVQQNAGQQDLTTVYEHLPDIALAQRAPQ